MVFFYKPCTIIVRNKYYYYYKDNLDIQINNTALHMATHPNVLVLTLDPNLHTPHTFTTLMATYKTVMRTTQEYASSIWSPLACSTSINKPQVMQNAALRTATGYTQDTNIQHVHVHFTSHTRPPTAPPHNTNIKKTMNHIPYTNIKHYFNTKRLKHYLQQRPLHNKYSHRSPHSHYKKTNMCHIHTSIVSMHLATRGNNKILRIPPSHISSSEVILHRLTLRTLTQLITNIPPFLKSCVHKVDYKSHTSPLSNTHTHNTHNLYNCTHIRTTLSPLNLWTDPAGVTVLLARWTEKLAGRPQAGRSDSPVSRYKGVGRQQQDG